MLHFLLYFLELVLNGICCQKWKGKDLTLNKTSAKYLKLKAIKNRHKLNHSLIIKRQYTVLHNVNVNMFARGHPVVYYQICIT